MCTKQFEGVKRINPNEVIPGNEVRCNRSIELISTKYRGNLYLLDVTDHLKTFLWTIHTNQERPENRRILSSSLVDLHLTLISRAILLYNETTHIKNYE